MCLWASVVFLVSVLHSAGIHCVIVTALFRGHAVAFDARWSDPCGVVLANSVSSRKKERRGPN